MSKKQLPKKQFIVRKYVMARNVIDAIKQEKQIDVEDVWVDADWSDKEEEIKGFK